MACVLVSMAMGSTGSWELKLEGTDRSNNLLDSQSLGRNGHPSLKLAGPCPSPVVLLNCRLTFTLFSHSASFRMISRTSMVLCLHSSNRGYPMKWAVRINSICCSSFQLHSPNPPWNSYSSSTMVQSVLFSSAAKLCTIAA